MKSESLDRLPLDLLVSVLEQTLPGFTFNLSHLGKGMPVMLNWKHTSKALAFFEGRHLLMRCVTAPNIRAAFLHIHNRLEDFAKDQQRQQKKDSETEEQRKRQVRMAAERQAALEKRRKKKDEKEAPEPEKEENIGPVLDVQHSTLLTSPQ